MSDFGINQKEEHNIEIPVVTEEGDEGIKLFDLNKIFQLNFSYNFEILKNLIETVINNQKRFQNEMDDKNSRLSELEAQLLDYKILLNDKNGDKETIQQLTEKKSKINQQSQGKNNIQIPSRASVRLHKGGIRPPPNDIKLEVSIGNDDVINKIIVSYIKYKLFFELIYRKK